MKRTPARLAGMILLSVWVGPVTLGQNDAWQLLRLAGAPESASAASRVIPAGEAVLLEPGTPLKLKLKDGSVVRGRFLGRTLLDSTIYHPRFTVHSRAAGWMPFALGEMLHVTLRDGREWTAPFAGYGELTLVLRSPEGPQFLRVPFEFAREIRRANGERIEPKALIRAFQDGALPSAEALALGEIVPLESMVDQWGSALRVAVEDIRSVSAQLPGGSNSAAGNAAGIVILSVVATLVLIGVALSSASSGCSSPNIDIPNFLGVQLTTRPFDLDRGCFVGDALAVEEAPAEPAPVAAVDVPATSQLPDWTSCQLARRSTSTSR